ncbi:hypothetical protein ACFPRL_10295 [Pseudoclavibacter helvolus]
MPTRRSTRRRRRRLVSTQGQAPTPALAVHITPDASLTDRARIATEGLSRTILAG